MALGGLCFIIIPVQMLKVFSTDSLVIGIGKTAFLIIGISFIPIVTSLIFPVFFQAVGMSLVSSLLTILRTIILFVPLGYMFSRSAPSTALFYNAAPSVFDFVKSTSPKAKSFGEVLRDSSPTIRWGASPLRKGVFYKMPSTKQKDIFNFQF